MIISQFNDFAVDLLKHHGLAAWAASLPPQLAVALDPARHGHLQTWQAVLASLPTLPIRGVDFNQGAVCVGGADSGGAACQAALRAQLQAFHPWRKGPYAIHGVHIDTEWRSDWKWSRLAAHLAPLQGRRVLDVGCGNGYYGWRMLGAGAELVVGLDPTLVSVMQFYAMRHFLGNDWPLLVLPLGIEALPPRLAAFDTVFSMGLLYHRRSPLDHLLELRGSLRRGGELVLETLVIEGDAGQVLVPPDRYARMRNVWFIPTPATLLAWLQRCGFSQPRLVDVTPTSVDEQRSTPWMRFESLAESLAPDNPALTVEGLPAPRRGIFLAQAD